MDITTVQRRLEIINKLQEEIKISKEMLKAELENDQEYLAAAEESKQAVLKKKQLKEMILSRGSNQKLTQDIKSNQEELSTLKEILSAELVQLYARKGTQEITDANGRIMKFKVTVKLVPAKDSDYSGLEPPKEVSLP